jgi:hypothetical protein
MTPNTVILEEVNKGHELVVNKDVLEFLEIHDVEIKDDIKYYIFGNFKYRVKENEKV